MQHRFQWGAAVCALFLLQTALAQDWPTTRFLAHAGTPNAGFFDDILPVDPPMTPAVAADLEDYLNSVAQYLQTNFPPPALQRTDQLDNGPGGPPAYMVYYYDAGDSFGTAAYFLSRDCGNPEAGTIRINATGFIENSKISTKGYVDLAHELFHAIQMNTRVGKENCPSRYGHWILEGQAEAFGQDMAMRFRNTASNNPLVRWGGRPTYNKELYISPDPGGNLSKQAYQTSSFWRYLAEAWYLRNTLRVGSRPGPDLGSEYGTNYAYLADLMNQPIPGKGQAAEMEWINSWVSKNLNADLYQVYTDFVSVLAQYGRYRFTGSQSVETTEARWRNTVFGGQIEAGVPASACTAISLSPDQPVGMASLSMGKVATRCIELDIGAFDTPKTFEISIVAEDRSRMRQVRLAMAGGQQVQTATVIADIPNSSGVFSTWPFELQNNRKQYLLLTNVAQQPGETTAQGITFHIGLPGHDSSEGPAAYRTSTPQPDPSAVKPGPAGAAQARELRHSQMVPGTQGVGSTSWAYRPEQIACHSELKWRIHCSAATELQLTVTRPAGMDFNGSSDATGGIFAKVLEVVPAANYEELMRFETYLEDTPGTKIDLLIPEIDYGFTGQVNDALIRISGGANSPDLVSLGPSPVYPTPPCAYGPPVGKVTIDEFSPLLLRGSYSAAVIKAGSPWNVKTCPQQPVIKTVTGTFIITAPLMRDARHEIDASWLEEQMFTDIGGMMPPGLDFDLTAPAAKPGSPGSSTGQGNSSSGSDDLDDISAEDCVCTCEEFKKGMQVAQNMMVAGGGEPEWESLRLMTCMSFCAAKISDCPF